MDRTSRLLIVFKKPTLNCLPDSLSPIFLRFCEVELILIMNAGDIITQIQHQAPNIIAIVAAAYMFAHWKAGKWVDILSTFLIAVVIYCLATGQNVWTFGLALLNAILGVFGWHIG